MTELSFPDAFRMWLRIGLLSFGGPAGQIALLHRELVEERKLMGEKEFLSALNFCMFLPGPEAMQLATYAGWKLDGLRGGVLAGTLFVLPGALLILALSAVYASFGQLTWIAALFWGIKAAVLAIVLEALLKVTGKSLRKAADWWVAALSFAALFIFAVPFAMVILAAGLFGFTVLERGAAADGNATRPSLAGTAKIAAAGLALWLVPLAGLHLLYGSDHIFSELSRIFSTLAVVTFGGAYAVLTALGQEVVEQAKWLTTQEMMDGLALAETTPGPLILVGQFVAFLAAHKQMGLAGGLAAAAIFLWMTFVPCFLWIFAGAPWIEYVQGRPRLAGALSAISAAVVGVILNLTLWFGLHVIFGRVERLSGPVPLWWPDLATFDILAFALSVLLALMLLKGKAGIPKTLALAAASGLLLRLILPQLL